MNQEVDLNDITKCKCSKGFFISIKDQIGFKSHTLCEKCEDGSVVSSDGKRCLQCPGQINNNTLNCQCKDGEALIDMDLYGYKFEKIKQCIMCDTEAYPGPFSLSKDVTQCQRCPHPAMTYNRLSNPWKCVCDSKNNYITAGDTCISKFDKEEILSQYDISNVIKVQFDNVISLKETFSKQKDSDTIKYYFYQATIGCIKYKDPKQCQSFANLCVLNIYNSLSAVCKLYKERSQNSISINGKLGWHQDYPWLFYQESSTKVLQQTDFEREVSMNEESPNYFLDFYVNMYKIDGTYLGMKRLINQFHLCKQKKVTESKSIFEFGSSIHNNCEYYIPSLLNQESLFYELYLKDIGATYLPLAALIKNYKDENGEYPNQKNDKSQWKFVRRFMIVDSLSGITEINGYSQNKKPEIIRFAKNIRIKIILQKGVINKIYLPYIEIEYAEKDVSILSDSPTEQISFYIDYEFDTGNFWRYAQIFFILIQIVVVSHCILRTYIWIKNNPKSFNPQVFLLLIQIIFNLKQFYSKAIMNILFFLIDCWSTWMFWLIFFFTAIWFIFFKMTQSVYFVMPPRNQFFNPEYNSFIAIFVIIFITKLVSLLLKIKQQAQIDIFFIDWEEQQRPKFDQAMGDSKQSPSIWRTLLVANEYNELNETRYMYIEWIIVIFTYLMRGWNWERLALELPKFTTDYQFVRQTEINIVLKFFLTSFLLLLIGGIQIIIRLLVRTWFPTKVQEFSDLCSIANISVYILDDGVHGYYIHGKSPNLFADVSLERLNLGLAEQQKAQTKGRGLLPNSDLQTYEMYVPIEVKKEYNKILESYQKEINPKQSVKQDIQGTSQQGEQHKLISNYSVQLNKFKIIEDCKRRLNDILKLQVNRIQQDAAKYIKDKFTIQRLIGNPPFNLETLKELPLFYKDPYYSFDKLFFCGMEFNILVAIVCVYEFFDILVENTLISVLLMYFIFKLIEIWRQQIGESNISKKTLIDEKFLI